MKATFQDKFLHGYIGMNTAGITQLYRPGIAINRLIIDRFLPIFSSAFLSENITSFKKRSLFYAGNIRLSSSKLHAGTLSDNYKSLLVPGIADSYKNYNKQIALGDNQGIALKDPFFQSFLVKSHVLDVP